MKYLLIFPYISYPQDPPFPSFQTPKQIIRVWFGTFARYLKAIQNLNIF